MAYFDSIVTSDEFAKDIRVYNMGEMIDTISEKESIESAERYEKFTNKTIKYEVILAFASALLLLISYLFVGGKAYYGIITVSTFYKKTLIFLNRIRVGVNLTAPTHSSEKWEIHVSIFIEIELTYF